MGHWRIVFWYSSSLRPMKPGGRGDSSSALDGPLARSNIVTAGQFGCRWSHILSVSPSQSAGRLSTSPDLTRHEMLGSSAPQASRGHTAVTESSSRTLGTATGAPSARACPTAGQHCSSRGARWPSRGGRSEPAGPGPVRVEPERY